MRSRRSSGPCPPSSRPPGSPEAAPARANVQGRIGAANAAESFGVLREIQVVLRRQEADAHQPDIGVLRTDLIEWLRVSR
jgi:hypothetical protein